VAVIGPTSRYRLTPTKIDDLVSPGRFRFETWRVPDIDMTVYNQYTVTEADLMRIDLIAYRMLGSVNFWWAIALVNNIANPIEDLEAGMTLRIPTRDAIAVALSQSESSL